MVILIVNLLVLEKPVRVFLVLLHSYVVPPISWKSKACHSVTLSSTEAEYYARSETAKEMMFIKSILETLGEKNKLHLPMLLCMDNTGAIYLSNNQALGSRTKHIDICTHTVRNLINEEVIKTLFVKSENNAADIFTKNATEYLELLLVVV